MNQEIIIFLSFFSGAIGIIAGTIVNTAAEEEVKGFHNTFMLMRNYFFLFSAALFLYMFGVMAVILGLLLLGSLLKHTALSEQSNTIALLTIIMLIFTSHTFLFPYIVSIFFIIGILEAGVWGAEHHKHIKKGLFQRKLWQVVIQQHALYFVLPLSSIFFLL